MLHVAAEFGNLEAAQLLLERGADVNARARSSQPGLNGQTPIFHAATQFQDFGLGMVQFLVKHGADLSIRARLPGHYERPDELVECSPLGYALTVPGRKKTRLWLFSRPRRSGVIWRLTNPGVLQAGRVVVDSVRKTISPASADF